MKIDKYIDKTLMYIVIVRCDRESKMFCHVQNMLISLNLFKEFWICEIHAQQVWMHLYTGTEGVKELNNRIKNIHVLFISKYPKI